MNSQQQLLGRWIRYLDASQASNTLLSTIEPSIRLLGGGRWSYAPTTSTLTWSDTAYLSFPGLADAANTIPAGSATVPSGSVAYVVSNAPFVTTATTVSGSATLTGVEYADQVQVGWQASGAGIPSGALVSGVDAASQTVTLSASATASASGVTVTFAGSGTLSVQVTPIASFAITANSVILARATATDCIVGVGTGQMLLMPQESKRLLGPGYLATSQLTAGVALTYGQPVYVSQGTDGRTSGSVYPCDASAANGAQRAAMLGFAHASAAAGATARVVEAGTVQLSGLTPGATYYLDPATVGGITATKPGVLLQYVCPVGVAISATTLLLTPPSDRAPRTLDSMLSHSTIFMGGVAVPSNYTANTALYPYAPSWNGSTFVAQISYYWPRKYVYLTDLSISLLQSSPVPAVATLSLGYETNQGTSTTAGPQGILITRTADFYMGVKSSGYAANTRDASLSLTDNQGYYFVTSFGSNIAAGGAGVQARITVAY